MQFAVKVVMVMHMADPPGNPADDLPSPGCVVAETGKAVQGAYKPQINAMGDEVHGYFGIIDETQEISFFQDPDVVRTRHSDFFERFITALFPQEPGCPEPLYPGQPAGPGGLAAPFDEAVANDLLSVAVEPCF